MAPNRSRAKRANAKKQKREQRRRAARFEGKTQSGPRAAPLLVEFPTRRPLGRMTLAVPPSKHPTNPPFLAANLELGYMARELMIVRHHNKSFEEGDPQDSMLMFSEAGVVLMTMERFLRTILRAHNVKVAPGFTLPNLLQLAFSERVDALAPPGGDGKHLITLVTTLRNALLHANFEQAAKEGGCVDVQDYFRNRFAKQLETLYTILNTMASQIDPATGVRYETQDRRDSARTRIVAVLGARRRKLERSRTNG